jgi:hypothetical protein
MFASFGVTCHRRINIIRPPEDGNHVATVEKVMVLDRVLDLENKVRLLEARIAMLENVPDVKDHLDYLKEEHDKAHAAGLADHEQRVKEAEEKAKAVAAGEQLPDDDEDVAVNEPKTGGGDPLDIGDPPPALGGTFGAGVGYPGPSSPPPQRRNRRPPPPNYEPGQTG